MKPYPQPSKLTSLFQIPKSHSSTDAPDAVVKEKTAGMYESCAHVAAQGLCGNELARMGCATSCKVVTATTVSETWQTSSDKPPPPAPPMPAGDIETFLNVDDVEGCAKKCIGEYGVKGFKSFTFHDPKDPNGRHSSLPTRRGAQSVSADYAYYVPPPKKCHCRIVGEDTIVPAPTGFRLGDPWELLDIWTFCSNEFYVPPPPSLPPSTPPSLPPSSPPSLPPSSPPPSPPRISEILNTCEENRAVDGENDAAFEGIDDREECAEKCIVEYGPTGFKSFDHSAAAKKCYCSVHTGASNKDLEGWTFCSNDFN